MSRPRILITLDLSRIDRRGVAFDAVEMKTAYARAVEAAGGLPLPVTPTDDPEVIDALIGLLDGLVVTGGAFDIEPERYGATNAGVRVDAPRPLRTRFETALVEGALARDRPLLGVCGGMQLLNVMRGGTLVQDIGSQVDGAIEHEQLTSPAGPGHAVELVEGCALRRLTGLSGLAVNSTHHQSVDRLGKGLVVQGRSPDGVIEAIALDDALQVFGVQWHPELLDDVASRAIYGALVAAARG